MKYRPNDPEFFGSLHDARAWAQQFFQWYNHQHHHSGLGLLTPGVVHSGQATCVLAARQQVLQQAYAAHPERFLKGPSVAANLPPEVWINRPQPLLDLTAAVH